MSFSKTLADLSAAYANNSHRILRKRVLSQAESPMLRDEAHKMVDTRNVFRAVVSKFFDSARS
jgi:hypothetical protein